MRASTSMENRKKHKIGISFASNTLFSVVFNIVDAFVRQTKFFNFFPLRACVCCVCVFLGAFGVSMRTRARVNVFTLFASYLAFCARQCFASIFRFCVLHLHTNVERVPILLFVVVFVGVGVDSMLDGGRYIHFLCLHLFYPSSIKFYLLRKFNKFIIIICLKLDYGFVCLCVQYSKLPSSSTCMWRVRAYVCTMYARY